MRIINTILKELPEKVIKSANFEAANIVLYTEKKDFFLNGEPEIKKVVDKIKKRIILRAEESLLMEKEKAEEFIRKKIPEEAEITQIIFDESRGLVIIEVKKPGMAIGKNGEILNEIKRNTFWTPLIRRSPAIKSKITEGIRHVLYISGAYRKKFLNAIGKKIYKEWSPEKKEEWVRLSFLGGARQVGRSCLLLQTPQSKILLDCGIDIAASNKNKFPILTVPEFNIKEIDAIIITHSHLDHSGMVPYLYKMGYRGPVYMTAPTRDIAALLALDFIGVSYKQAKHPLFSMSDVKEMVKHSIALDYNVVTDITPDIRITLYNAGHALGSAMVHINVGNGLHNLLYTGDFKYSKTKTLDPAVTKFPRLETLIMESTYGSKYDVLPSRKEAEKQLIDATKKTLERKGKVLMPVLGVGRSQEVMLILENAMSSGLLPKVNIYIDGLLWDVTAIHTAYPDFLNNAIKNRIFRDENPFGSKIFKNVGSPQERKKILESGPCIIIATSGMLVGGASVEYFKELAPYKKNCIILTCYQGVNSLGRKIKEGEKEVTVEGEEGEEKIKVEAEVVSIDALTGHSTRKELLAFINNINPTPRRIIINHGEASKCLDLASTLYKLYRIETNVPRLLETLRLK